MSLFSRLSNGDNDDKIAIHAFTSALDEWRRGYMSGPDIIAIFQLDGSDHLQASALKDLLNAAVDKQEFLRVLKNVLYLAETGLEYTSGGDAFQRLQDAVTDGGGTLP